MSPARAYLVRKANSWPGRVVVLGCALLLSGCAGGQRGLYAEVGEEFSRGFASGAAIVDAGVATAVRDARRLALVHYLEHGNTPTNLDRDDIDASFVRYVCVGAGRYSELRSALSVLDEYRRMVAQLSSAPAQDVAQLWASIKKLRAPQKPLRIRETSVNDYALCVSRVAALIPPVGRAAADRDEPVLDEEATIAGILGAYEALSALIAAAERIAALGLSQVDEAARVDAVRAYVLDNRETVDALIGDPQSGVGGMSAAVLEQAHHNRMVAAVVAPYYRFHDLMMLDRTADRSEMVNREAEIHAALAEFDAVYAQPPPRDIAIAMRDAQEDLVRLARGELSPAEAHAVFRAFAMTLDQLHDAVGDLAGSAQRLRQATGG